MAFPQDPRVITASFYLNGQWVDAEGDGAVLQDRGLNIKRGQSDWGSALSAGSASFTLKNLDGRWSTENPTSPYYGYFGQNVPCMIAVDTGDDVTLHVPGGGYASAPDSAALSITGDIDLAAELRYEATSATTHLISKWSASAGQRSYWFYIDTNGALNLSWTTDGSTLKTLTSTDTIIPGRQAVRVQLDVNTGSGTHQAIFLTSPSIGGADPWSVLGDAVTGSGTTSIFDSTSAVRIGSNPAATDQNYVDIFEVEIRGVSLVGNPDFTAQTPGASSFVEGSNTWTITAPATITSRSVRFHGEVFSLEDNCDDSGNFVYLDVEVRTALHRLGRGKSPVKTAMETWIPQQTRASLKADAYWPLNEGEGAITGRNLIGAYPQQLIRSTSPTSRFGRGDLKLPWVDNGVELYTGDTLSGIVKWRSGSGTNAWEVDFLYACQTGASAQSNIFAFEVHSFPLSFHLNWWKLLFRPDTQQIGIERPDGTQVFTSTVGWDFDPFDGVGKLVTARFRTPSANTTVIDFVISTLSQGVSHFGTNDYANNGMSDSVSGYEAGSLYAVELQHTGDVDKPFVINHLSTYEVITTNLQYEVEIPYSGQSPEQADARIARLCDEKNIRFATPGGLYVFDVLLGPQAPGAFLDLLRESAAAGMGLLSEPREDPGFLYRQLSELANQDAALTLDYSAHQPAPPLPIIRDDQQVVNTMTVTRKGGGKATFTQTTGRYAAVDPADGGAGIYEQSVTLNLWSDDQAADAAAWAVHLGTLDAPRFPSVKVNLANSAITPTLASDVIAVDLGDRIDITNMQRRGVYDDMPLMVIGYTERINTFEHSITFVCLPYQGYQTLLVDEPGHKVDSGGSTVNTAFNAGSGTSLSVAVSDGALWSTSAAQYPLHIKVGGVVLNVTACSGTSSPQTMTVDATTVNGVTKTIPAGTVVKLARPATVAYVERG